MHFVIAVEIFLRVRAKVSINFEKKSLPRDHGNFGELNKLLESSIIIINYCIIIIFFCGAAAQIGAWPPHS